MVPLSAFSYLIAGRSERDSAPTWWIKPATLHTLSQPNIYAIILQRMHVIGFVRTMVALRPLGDTS
jgi:hypothetical protein